MVSNIQASFINTNNFIGLQVAFTKPLDDREGVRVGDAPESLLARHSAPLNAPGGGASGHADTARSCDKTRDF
jgi:hypothetical protein